MISIDYMFMGDQQAREEERGFRRSQSREEKKMSFKEKGKWFHALKPAKFTA